MKNVLLLIALSAASQFAHACDATSSLPLAGVVSVDTCRARDPGCVSASRAVYQHIEAQHDDPTSFSIAGHASPWRFYSGEHCAGVRTKRDPKVNRVELDGSQYIVNRSCCLP